METLLEGYLCISLKPLLKWEINPKFSSKSLLQWTLSKTDTFGTGPKCPSYRGVRLKESQIKGVKKKAGTNSKCPFYRGVRLIEVSVKRESTVRLLRRLPNSRRENLGQRLGLYARKLRTLGNFRWKKAWRSIWRRSLVQRKTSKSIQGHRRSIFMF